MTNEHSEISKDFKDIDFGKADAVNEKELLIDGFLDTEGYIDRIVSGNVFFVIGQKGSGKSAIATRLKIVSERENEINVLVQMLDEFDYDGFGGVIPGKEMPEIHYGNTWEFLLALKFIEMYAATEYDLTKNDSDPRKLVAAFKKLSILPNSLKSIINTFKIQDFKVDAMVLKFTGSKSNIEKRDIKKLINSTISCLYDINPKKKHFIVLDGLDSVLSKREKQYGVLSSLIRTANLMNHKFSDSGIRSKVVVLCRKDVLNKLNDPNRSKYIRDSGIELNWYQSVTDIRNTNLYKLINLRAKNSLKTNVDVFETFFPTEVNGRNTFRYLLDNTRFTPRDIIQLMNCIQKVSGKDMIDTESIRIGINDYSESYFILEIKDSLVGMLSNDEIEDSFKALRFLGKVEFTAKEFADNLPKERDAVAILSALYIAGAISNIEKDEKGVNFRASYIRNPNSSFNEKKRIAVNNGLKKALMLH